MVVKGRFLVPESRFARNLLMSSLFSGRHHSLPQTRCFSYVMSRLSDIENKEVIRIG
jgi:hypothetical protein